MEKETNHVGRPTNEEVNEKKKNKLIKVILSIIAVIALLFIAFSVGSAIFTNSTSIKLNKTATIKEDNIKITVLGSENVKVDEGEFSIVNGEYTKVKLTIENYGNEEYSWSPLNFSLDGKIPDTLTFGLSDLIETNIAPGTKETGYIYFPVTNSAFLEYTSNAKEVDAIDSETAKVKASKTHFKIK